MNAIDATNSIDALNVPYLREKKIRIKNLLREFRDLGGFPALLLEVREGKRSGFSHKKRGRD
jgi:hypothetical protein